MRCVEWIVIVWMVGLTLFSCRNMQTRSGREESMRKRVRLTLPVEDNRKSVACNWLGMLNRIPRLGLARERDSKEDLRPRQAGPRVKVNIVNLMDNAVVTVKKIALKDTADYMAGDCIDYDIVMGSSITDIQMQTVYRGNRQAYLEVAVRYEPDRMGHSEKKDTVYRYMLGGDPVGKQEDVASWAGLYDATLVLMGEENSPEGYWQVMDGSETEG